MYRCTDVHMYMCSYVQVFICTGVQVLILIRGVVQKLNRCISVVVLLCSLLGSMSWCSGPEHTWTSLGLLLGLSPPAGTVTWKNADYAHPATPTYLAHQSDLNQEEEMVSTWVRVSNGQSSYFQCTQSLESVHSKYLFKKCVHRIAQCFRLRV